MKRRKVSNLLALAVLSTVYQRPMHRYEMASVMRARGKDQDLNIKWGSLYTVVENLAKHGFLEPIGNSRQGARPERTIYQITDEGRQELLDWTRELISTPAPEHPAFVAGLSVLTALPPSEAIALLSARLGLVEKAIAGKQAALEKHSRDVPRLFLVEDEYELAMAKAEADWIRSLLEEFTSGTHPNLALWEAWHKTGAVPPELAELVERGAMPD